MAKKWTEQEEKFIKENLSTMNATDMAKTLGRQASSVRRKMQAIHEYDKWTHEEDQVLLDAVGSVSISLVAGRLGRSIPAIIARLGRLGIYNIAEYAGLYTSHTLAEILNVSTKTITTWVNDFGLPSNQFYKSGSSDKIPRKNFISSDEFWEWAYENQKHVHFAKIKRGELIPEPEWLDEVIQKETKSPRHQSEWTTLEDRRLKDYIVNQKLTQQETSVLLGRSPRAISRRIAYLNENNMWSAPVKKATRWSDDEIDKMKELRKEGKTFEEISKIMGRTVRAVAYKMGSLS